MTQDTAPGEAGEGLPAVLSETEEMPEPRGPGPGRGDSGESSGFLGAVAAVAAVAAGAGLAGGACLPGVAGGCGGLFQFPIITQNREPGLQVGRGKVASWGSLPGVRRRGG